MNLASLPRTAEDFYMFKDMLTGQIRNATNQTAGSNSMFENTIKNLEQIKEDLRVQEKDFFNLIGSTDWGKGLADQPDAALKALNTRLELLKNDSSSMMLTANSGYNYLTQGIGNGITGIDFNQAVDMYLVPNGPIYNKIVEALKTEIVKNGGQLAFSAIEPLFSSINLGIQEFNITNPEGMKTGVAAQAGVKAIDSFTGNLLTSASFTKDGEIKLAAIKFKAVTKYGDVTTTIIGPSKDTVKHYKELGIEFRYQGQPISETSQGSLREQISQALRAYVIPTSIIGSQIEQELSSSKVTDYFINNNPQVLKGFLGELRANAVLNWLFGNQAQDILATGNIKDAVRANESIPIDTFLNGIGIQIKNYSEGKYFDEISGNGATASYVGRGEKVNTAMDLHFQIPQPINNIIKELFAIEQFNQPIDKSSPFADAYNDLMEANEDVKSIFDLNAYHIFKFENLATTLPASLSSKDTHNTIFIINDKFILGSTMIQAIIESLKTNSSRLNSGMITSAYSFTKTTLESFEKAKKQSKAKVRPENLCTYANYANTPDTNWPSAEQALTQFAITYNLTLRLDELFHHAYTNSERLAR